MKPKKKKIKSAYLQACELEIKQMEKLFSKKLVNEAYEIMKKFEIMEELKKEVEIEIKE